MRSSPYAVFRCDAGGALGGGHLRRCLTLAEALAANGWRAAFAVCPETLAFLPRDPALQPDWIVLDTAEEHEPAVMAARLGAGEVDLLVVDHYGRDRRFEGRCRRFARGIAAIDDLADRPHDADLLLDQTFGRSGRDYAGLVSRSCTLLCGSRHALLRPAFAEMREAAIDRRRQGGSVVRILIGMGAADADDFTSLAVAAVGLVSERLGRPFTLDVVLGAGAPHLDAVRRRLSGFPAWSIHLNASGRAMARLMAAADLAIGAAGTTSWERCCLALPTVCVVAAENQAKIAAELAAAGACRVAAAGAPEGLAAAVDELCRDDPARLAMAEAAAAVCDGAGTQRVVGAIEAMVTAVPAEAVPA